MEDIKLNSEQYWNHYFSWQPTLRKHIKKVLTNMGISLDFVDDVLQVVAEKILTRNECWTNEGHLRCWFYAVVRSQCIKLSQQQMRIGATDNRNMLASMSDDADADDPIYINNPLSGSDDEDVEDFVERRLRNVAKNSTFDLYYHRGQSVAEIASLSNKKQSSIRSELSRFHGRLRRDWNQLQKMS